MSNESVLYSLDSSNTLVIWLGSRCLTAKHSLCQLKQSQLQQALWNHKVLEGERDPPGWHVYSYLNMHRQTRWLDILAKVNCKILDWLSLSWNKAKQFKHLSTHLYLGTSVLCTTDCIYMITLCSPGLIALKISINRISWATSRWWWWLILWDSTRSPGSRDQLTGRKWLYGKGSSVIIPHWSPSSGITLLILKQFPTWSLPPWIEQVGFCCLLPTSKPPTSPKYFSRGFTVAVWVSEEGVRFLTDGNAFHHSQCSTGDCYKGIRYRRLHYSCHQLNESELNELLTWVCF